MRVAFERCVITKGVKTKAASSKQLLQFERCVITKGVKTEIMFSTLFPSFERCVITKGVKTRRFSPFIRVSLRGV